jgi:hypothetical protein
MLPNIISISQNVKVTPNVMPSAFLLSPPLVTICVVAVQHAVVWNKGHG